MECPAGIFPLLRRLSGRLCSRGKRKKNSDNEEDWCSEVFPPTIKDEVQEVAQKRINGYQDQCPEDQCHACKHIMLKRINRAHG